MSLAPLLVRRKTRTKKLIAVHLGKTLPSISCSQEESLIPELTPWVESFWTSSYLIFLPYLEPYVHFSVHNESAWRSNPKEHNKRTSVRWDAVCITRFETVTCCCLSI
jgi:hypothetical protein